jgi:hypothetical protein
MKKYCYIFDAYYREDKWLESKCCEGPNDDCMFNCWERPDIPCVNCKYKQECKSEEEFFE